MPFKSQAQRAMAHAIASGKKPKKGNSMTAAVARRLVAEDSGGKLPKKIRKKGY